MIGVRCTIFCFVLFYFVCFIGCTSSHTAQTRCVGGGWSLGQLGLWSYFFVSSHDRSSLHEFLYTGEYRLCSVSLKFFLLSTMLSNVSSKCMNQF